MSRESALELKVGSFVLVAVCVLTFFVASISDFSVFEKGKRMEAIFVFANGLRDAAPVRLSCVEAGVVKHLDVFVDDKDGQKTKVRVIFWLKQGKEVPVDSTITINQLGLLGEKYIEIIPGVSQEFLKEGAVLIGRDPVPMEKITEQVSLITTKLETTIDGINNGILTAKNKQSIEDGLEGFGVLGKNLKEGRGTIGKLLNDESIYQNLEELTVDLKSNPWKLLYKPRK